MEPVERASKEAERIISDGSVERIFSQRNAERAAAKEKLTAKAAKTETSAAIITESEAEARTSALDAAVASIEAKYLTPEFESSNGSGSHNETADQDISAEYVDTIPNSSDNKDELKIQETIQDELPAEFSADETSAESEFTPSDLDANIELPEKFDPAVTSYVETSEASAQSADAVDEKLTEALDDELEVIPEADAASEHEVILEENAAPEAIPENVVASEHEYISEDAVFSESEIISVDAAAPETESEITIDEDEASECKPSETEDFEQSEIDAVAEFETAASGRAAKNIKKTKKRKMKPLAKVLIALLAIVILAGAAVGIATYTKYLTWFKDGPMISNKEDLTMQLDSEDLEKLNNFKDLKHVDLTGSPAGFEAVKAWADDHPNVDVDYTVDLPEDAVFDASTGEIDFTKVDAATAISSIGAVQEMLKGKSVKIDPKDWTADDIESFTQKLTRFTYSGSKIFENASVEYIDRFMKSAPDLEFSGTVALDNIESSIEATTGTLDFSEITDEGLAELDKFLDVLPVYSDIELGSEFAHDRLANIYSFYEKHPDITVHYEFGVLGQRHDINDTILDFNHIYMHDQGAEVREVISCMPKLRVLDMDWCLVDNEHMEAIRNDFPNVDVNWRLWFPSNEYYSVRTDAEKIFLSAFGGGMLTNSDCEQLKYCTKVKYMDIGHNEGLSDASFLAYMPELEVLVLSINLIDDISGLANCPHLEYMEMFNTHITNLDALANCKELKHLNVCQNPYLTDISGVYDIDGIERFWVGDIWSTSVPREQVEKYKELHPGTLTCDYTYGAHTAGWREGARYELLWKQMGYDEEDSDYSYYWLDPENPSHPWWTKYTEENGYSEANGYYNKYPVLQTGMWF